MEEIGSVLEFLDNKSIFVIGATGFLGKVLMEKILRTEPNIRKIYLLIKAGDNKEATLRLQNEVIGKDLFKVLKQKLGADFTSFISEKVNVVPGDITDENLRIKDFELKSKMLKEIDVIVNFAATTNFYERYDISLLVNVYGAKSVLDFAKKCNNIKILTHVSTAYVSGETAGLIQEKPYYMGESLNGRPGLDINAERQLTETKLAELRAVGATEDSIKSILRDLGIERAKHWGWPNTYVFTKALGEMLLLQGKGDLPITIIRPTIVTSTFKEPFPGWIEGLRTLDSVFVAYAKGKLNRFVWDSELVIDMIPADMVVNATIVAMVAHANQGGAKPTIYHIGSSMRNPFKASILPEAGHRYLSQNPWINHNGKPVMVRRFKTFSSMAAFHRYVTIRFLLPLKALEIANAICCQRFKSKYISLNRKVRLVMHLVDIYKPYLFFQGTFDDINTEKLQIAVRENGAESDSFYFDPKAIDWEEYLVNTHFPGVVKYVLK